MKLKSRSRSWKLTVGIFLDSLIICDVTVSIHVKDSQVVGLLLNSDQLVVVGPSRIHKPSLIRAKFFEHKVLEV